MSLLKDFQEWWIKMFLIICLLALPIIACFLFLSVIKFIVEYWKKPIVTNDTYVEGYHSFTKAICNTEHYCIDVFVVCKNKEVIDIFPLGEGIQFSEDWEDPRPSSVIFKWC